MIEQEDLMPGEADTVRRYNAAMHGVQSAIAVEIQLLGANAAGADAKHLRTGVNSAMVNDHALANLLIEKGVFTRAEYGEAVAQAAEHEHAMMTDLVRKKTGMPNLTFG